MVREGACRMCRRPAKVRPLTRHHLVPQRKRDRIPNTPGVGGIHHPGNVVPLCRPCHDRVETDGLAAAMLRRVMHHDEVRFVRDTMGARWLNRNYPYWGAAPRPRPRRQAA